MRITPDLPLETMEARRQENNIFKYWKKLKKKKTINTELKSEAEKTFISYLKKFITKKLKEFMTERPVLQEMLKEAIQEERRWFQM